MFALLFISSVSAATQFSTNEIITGPDCPSIGDYGCTQHNPYAYTILPNRSIVLNQTMSIASVPVGTTAEIGVTFYYNDTSTEAYSYQNTTSATYIFYPLKRIPIDKIVYTASRVLGSGVVKINTMNFWVDPYIPTLNVSAFNAINNNSISGLCIRASNGTGNSTNCTTGTSITLTNASIPYGTYNLTIYNIGSGNETNYTYFNVTVNNFVFNLTNFDLSVYPFQSYINLSVYRLFLNTTINGFNVTNGLNLTTTVTSSLLVPANNGSNNVQVNVAGNYSKNTTCTVSAPLTTVQCNSTGIYDNQYTIDAFIVSGPLSSFTVRIYNNTLGGYVYNTSTTTRPVIFNLLQGYFYNFTINSSGYTTQTVFLPANASTHMYNFSMETIQLQFTFLDEITRNILNGTNISLAIIDSSGGTNVYTTTNGYLNVSNTFVPGTYTLRYSATNYSTRDYYATITSTITNFSLYLINQNDYTPGVVEVRDFDGTLVRGAIIKLHRYYGATSIPDIVQMATTNNDAQAVMTAQAIIGSYTWDVLLNGVNRFNTTTPELLAIESDGLWHKTFVLSTNATQTNQNTGLLHSFSPTGSLLNGTTYNFTFNATSTFWTLSSCTLELIDGSNGTVLASNTTYCYQNGGPTIQYTTGQNGTIIPQGTITTTSFSTTYRTMYTIVGQENNTYTIKYFFDDVGRFNSGGFNNTTKFFLAVIIIICIVFSLSRTTELINGQEEIMFLVGLLTILFGYVNWLYLNIPLIPSEPLKQWFIPIVIMIIGVVGILRKMGVGE